MKVLLGLVCLLAATLSVAQLGGMGMDMMYGPMSTLQRQEIRKEMKLTKDQVKQMDQVNDKFMKAAQSGNIQLDSLSKVDAELLAILDAPQKQRFSELNIQIRGATALSDKEVAAKLELTDDQKSKIMTIRKDAQSNLLSQVQKGSQDRKLMEKISKAEEKELLGLLTEEQRKAFADMAGVIFKGARTKDLWPI